ncbi:HNH endonuclease [Campylobacter coli]
MTTETPDGLFLLDFKEVKSLVKLPNYHLSKVYYADKDANVYKVIRGRNIAKKMNPYVNRDGYVEYVLTDIYGRKKHVLAHRMVAYLFIKKPFNKNYVNHIDGNRANNTVSNLEWTTQSANVKHSYEVLRKNRQKLGKAYEYARENANARRLEKYKRVRLNESFRRI